MTKKRLPLTASIVVILVIAVTATAVLVAPGRADPGIGIQSVMDHETSQLFEELSPAGQDLVSQVWEQIRETAPEHAWEDQVASYVRAFYKHEQEERSGDE